MDEWGLEPWSMLLELVAQLIEEVSITATETTRRKEPREVWRPDHIKRGTPASRKRPGNKAAGIKHAVNVLRATTPKAS